MSLDAALAGLVDACRRHAVAVVLGVSVATSLLGVTAIPRLAIDTDTTNIMSPDLAWRQHEAKLDDAFPLNTNLIVAVIDSDSPDQTEDAAQRLAERLSALAAAPDSPFLTVRRPDGGPFFRRHGVLFLPTEEVRTLAERTIEAQPLIGALTADPSLVGLLGLLEQVAEGLGRGEVGADRFDRPFEAIAGTIDATLAGEYRPLSWQNLLTGRTPETIELRRFVLVQPRLDFGAMQPGAAATTAIRLAAADLGLTPARGVRLRLTGPVPLNDEEFISVAEGTGGATIMSLVLICLLLVLALRSIRLIVAIVATLLAGFVVTAAFASLAVGSLNLISIAFAAIFFGIAVDFGIQFAVRYRQERHLADDLPQALRNTGLRVGRALALAAMTTAAGFLSFTPTDYSGVSELGLIAGFGMIVALMLNLTLMPALLALLRPRAEPVAISLAWTHALDRWITEHRRAVLAAGAALALAGGAAVPLLAFDDDPLNLKDPATESVATLNELADDPMTTPYVINILAANLVAARALDRRLEALPEVRQAVSLATFVPDDQPAKLEIIADLALLLGPTIETRAPAASHDTAAVASALATATARLNQVPSAARTPASAQLGRSLDAARVAVMRDASWAGRLEEALLAALPMQLDALRDILTAGEVRLNDLPEDLRRSWVTEDGRARIEVYPRDDLRDAAARDGFVAAVRAVAPDATGSPVTIYESGRTVVGAFATAGMWALAAVILLLVLVLRRAVDVVLVLAPLALAGLATVGASVAFQLPVTYANIITLPLMLGIGVGFSIYFVVNWRGGDDRPLHSATARAVLFSGLTTMAAFGSLAMSSHPGTADMGKLLTLALAATLLAVLVALPALLATIPRRK
ncbi:MAG: hypothetical protein FJX35_11415 [Alphaproteobacteria bacterium]|nr:hypothetical protein [Alphaproteobacteria bacterium]